jgi:hypothetical protein
VQVSEVRTRLPTTDTDNEVVPSAHSWPIEPGTDFHEAVLVLLKEGPSTFE